MAVRAAKLCHTRVSVHFDKCLWSPLLCLGLPPSSRTPPIENLKELAASCTHRRWWSEHLFWQSATSRDLRLIRSVFKQLISVFKEKRLQDKDLIKSSTKPRSALLYQHSHQQSNNAQQTMGQVDPGSFSYHLHKAHLLMTWLNPSCLEKTRSLLDFSCCFKRLWLTHTWCPWDQVLIGETCNFRSSSSLIHKRQTALICLLELLPFFSKGCDFILFIITLF